MRKNLKITLVCLSVLLFAGCSSDNSHKNDNKIPADSIKGENEAKLDNTDNQNNTEIAFTGEVDEYWRHYKRLENKMVTITGMWSNPNLLVSITNDSAAIDLILSNEFSNLNNEIIDQARIYVTGISKMVNDTPMLEVKDIQYINPLTEPYWSNSTLVTQEMVQYEEISAYEEYEMTVVAIDETTARIVGTYYLVDILPVWSLTTGEVARVLVSDMELKDNGLYECNLIEKISVE